MPSSPSSFNTPSGFATPMTLQSRMSSYSNPARVASNPNQSRRSSALHSRPPSPSHEEPPPSGLNRTLSLGIRAGPGHLAGVNAGDESV
jgi:alpha-1,3-glucan synthase